MYQVEDISVYILNWKKVSQNTVKLIENIKNHIADITIINCDDSFKFEDSIKTIELDDSHYYGSQYEHAILDIKDNKILCVIVGDNISLNDFYEIFKNSIEIFNKYKIGVYAPNDKRSFHVEKNDMIEENIFNVNNTDCGFWFINPEIVKNLKELKYSTLSPFGWGIDTITIKESLRLGYKVIRDYRVSTDQLDHTTNYNTDNATRGAELLMSEYEKLCESSSQPL